MTEQQLQIAESRGVPMDRFAQVANIVYMLSDVQEQYLYELESYLKQAGYYSFADKKIIEDAKRACRKVVNIIQHNTSGNATIEYGDECDKLKELIDKWIKE